MYIVCISATGMPRQTLRELLPRCRQGREGGKFMLHTTDGNHYVGIDRRDIAVTVLEQVRAMSVTANLVDSLPDGKRFPLPGEAARQPADLLSVLFSTASCDPLDYFLGNGKPGTTRQ